MSTLFVAWLDPVSSQWFPVGRLEAYETQYTFCYTMGAERAQREAGFEPLLSFPELRTTYLSENLFPLFSNRLLPRTRPDYGNYLGWLGVPDTERDPITILARSGGRKATDTLELFRSPEPNAREEYEVHFLIHGLGCLPDASMARALKLRTGDRLLAMRDFQNAKDPDALALRTLGQFDKDLYIIGFCPRYLRSDLIRLMDTGSAPAISVEKVNQAPAPSQFRILCKAVAKWPQGFQPFSEPDFQPLVPQDIPPAQVPLPHLHRA